MPRNPDRVMEDQIGLAKAQVLRLEAAKKESLKKSRRLLLKAHRSGFTQSKLARIWKTNPTRMKHILAQALSEETE